MPLTCYSAENQPVSFNIPCAKLFVSHWKQKVSLGKQSMMARYVMLNHILCSSESLENRGVFEQNR